MKQLLLIVVSLLLPLDTMANYCKLSFDETRNEFLVSRSEEVLKTFSKQELAKEFACRNSLCVAEPDANGRDVASTYCK